MSTSSFDDSSNLFDQSTTQNGEKRDQLTTDEKEKDLLNLEEPTEPAVEDTAHHSKSKASRALKLLKRAKSPIREQLKAAKSPFKSLKNLPKHHHKSPKSPSKSPSKENLTEEYSNLEQKLSEKKSEEWKEFQQMQERIKQTVLKTQTSLHKFKDHNGSEKRTKWTGFDEQESLEPEEIVDVSSATPEINISWASYETDDNSKKLLDTSKDLAHLDTTPIPSPPITPAPPHNSRISSMENLMEAAEKKQSATQEEVDLLGLGISSEPTPSAQTSEIMNQDLLGLGNDFLGTASSASGSENVEAFSYSITAPVPSEKASNRSTPVDFDPNKTISDADSEFFLTQTAPAGQPANLLEVFETKDKSSESDTFPTMGSGTYEKSAVPDIIGLAPQTSDLIIPGEKTDMSFTGIEGSDITKTDDLGMFPLMDNPLEPEAFKLEPTDQVVPQSMQTVQSSEMVLDDLSSLDPMKAEPSSNVSDMFGASSAPINIVSNAPPNILLSTSPNIYGTSPQSGAAGFGSYSSSQIPIEHDIMSKIQKFSPAHPPVSPGRRKVGPKAADPFSFVKKELKKKDQDKDIDIEDDGEYKSLVEMNKPKSVKVDTGTTEKETDKSENIPNIENNPFLSGDFSTEQFSNEGFNVKCDVAAVFGVEPVDNAVTESGIPVQGAVSPQQWTNVTETDSSFKDTWEDMSETKSGFDTDMAWDNKKAVTDQAAGDAWASGATASSGENVVDTTDGSSNPFQDDFAVFHEKNLSIIDIGEVDTTISNVNPFLDENIMGGTDTNVNPFLDTESVTVTKEPGSSILDNESFFLDSLGDTKVDNIPVAMDDDFDPFKVSESKEMKSEAKGVEVNLDLFASAGISAEKQQSKARNDDDDDDKGFVLEIKPMSARIESDTAIPAPALKPPPKAPKSPQPPRENPFDRDSPPEENFAQFEIKDTEKPKEQVAKSFSTESSTTEEEEVLEPLEPFLSKFEKEGFKLMLRYPTKKKITGNRYWKNVFVRVEKHKEGPMVKVFSDPNDALPLQELLLQACYSLSDCCLQQYDQYGKIHTVKLQYIFYKERVGIKTDRIAPSLVKLRSSKPKANMIMDHSPQVSELLKFGSLDKEEIILFMQEIEDTLMNLDAHREKTLTYNKDEVTAELHDEYKAELDKTGRVLSQKARVRIFILAFLTGMPTVELGLNDKRRRGKEVVGRNDIIPIKTEEWIRLEDVEFHCCVDKEEFEKTNNIKFHPLDACQFELLRYRVRLRENKELPMQLTIQQIFKDRKLEVRCDLLVTGYHSFSKKHGQFPCEDIEVRFPMPETWIYLFRYERRFGYGAFKSTTRKPGKIKGLERLTMMAQGVLAPALMEADVGTAKYEHIYRSVVWRIPRLPVRNQGAYTSHLFKLKLELGPHDEVPETFEQYANVEFTMPCATVSQSQIRSIAVTNPNPPEKWVRYLAKYEYRIEIEHLTEYPELMVGPSGVYEEESGDRVKSGSDNEEEEEVKEKDDSDWDDSSD